MEVLLPKSKWVYSQYKDPVHMPQCLPILATLVTALSRCGNEDIIIAMFSYSDSTKWVWQWGTLSCGKYMIVVCQNLINYAFILCESYSTIYFHSHSCVSPKDEVSSLKEPQLCHGCEVQCSTTYTWPNVGYKMDTSMHLNHGSLGLAQGENESMQIQCL